MSAYARDKEFRSCTAETRRNYATDIGLLLDFLWSRGRAWTEAREQDLEDFEHWRREAESIRRRIGGTKWDRELAAFMHLFKWAVKNKVMTHNPVATKQVMGRYGQLVTVPEARAKDARPSNVHWLTPRTWRRWIDIGLRGHTKDGVPWSCKRTCVLTDERGTTHDWQDDDHDHHDAAAAGGAVCPDQ
ncbi:hypothetical protein FE391_33680 [Nonomuraea sp. KC401]|nr:site-specific integrase [Nonomuraea sp. K271]TLF60435.1 hypothetical protein FE391_33680 [Nonomuraea sp. KC401]